MLLSFAASLRALLQKSFISSAAGWPSLFICKRLKELYQLSKAAEKCLLL